MITGRVSRDGVPVVMLPVAGQVWSATIDTGFNGYLELPNALRPFVNARFIGQICSFLAGGQTIVEDGYRVDFPFDGLSFRAEATFVPGSEILVGTRLLRQHRLEVNFVGATVRVEKVE